MNSAARDSDLWRRLSYDHHVACYHSFDEDDEETHFWSEVLPGDLVRSNGSYAYRAKDFAGMDDDTRVLTLRNGLLLVLSREDGIPNEDVEDDACYVTFVCMSRHGPLVLVQNRRRKT